MPRVKADKEYRNFGRGLVTEATGLTYPEGSVRSLDNIDLTINGGARRRLGISQEGSGTLVGGGTLTDTLFTNDTGGPLSLAPIVLAATVTKSYDGTAPTNGDWTVGGPGGASNNGSVWQLGCQRENASFMRQDLSLRDYDRISFSFSINETTSNEANLLVLIGCDVNGAGQGLHISRDGIRTVTTSAYDSGYVKSTVLYSYDGEDENQQYVVNLTKSGTNAYFMTIRVKDGEVVKYKRAGIPLGMSGDYLYFAAQSGQKHHAEWEVDDINIVMQIFGVNADLPDAELAEEGFAISTHAWTAPNGDGNKSIQVFQVGNTLLFRDATQEAVSDVGGVVPAASQSIPFDGIGTGFVYNMSSSQAAQVKLQSAVGFGRIWFTSKAVVPFYAELSEDGTEIRLRAVGTRDGVTGIRAATGERLIRDLIGIEDSLEVDDTPGTLTNEHLYNLLNQGWPSDKINDYFSSQSNYPANNQQWFLGKQSDDDFDPALLVEQDFGSSQATRGRIRIDALIGDRDGQAHAVSGITSPIDFDGQYNVAASTGWEAVAFYAGRVWFAGETNSRRPSCVYFSKTLEGTDDSGKFYSISDPTNEHFNDLVATDGGYIPIPEAGNIRKLVPFGAGLLVMADTGVWFVYGRDTGFKANNFAVEKITSTGAVSPGTVVRTDQAVYYWADNSIHQIAFSEQGENTTNNAYLPKVLDIGQTTVFSYYQDIGVESRASATHCFDPITKKVFWFYLSDTTKATQWQSLYDRALIFDQKTGAFTAYSWAAQYESLFGVACAFARRTPLTPAAYESVYDSNGDTVVDSLGVTVYSADTVSGIRAGDVTTAIKLVIVTGAERGLRIAEYGSLAFLDFDAFSGTEASEAAAFIETGDETLGDLQRNKQTTFVHSFFTRTESGFYPDQTPKRASGCKLRAKWDWTNGAVANRWSDPQSAYRYRKGYVMQAPSLPFDTGEEILYTKLKVRGKGRAVRFRYESEAGKDFRLLGFSVPFTANQV